MMITLMALLVVACDNEDEREGPVSQLSFEEQLQTALDKSITKNDGKGISIFA